MLAGIQEVLGLGAKAILPIIICSLGLFFRMKLRDAIKAGLTVGLGFLGLGLIITLLTSTLEPAVSFYQKLGSGYTIIDIGWAAVGAASWMAPFAALAIPVGLFINLALIRFGAVRTMNIDIWNYMHFLIPGFLTYVLFSSAIAGFLVTILMSVIAIFVGDQLAPRWQKYFGLEGTTCTTVNLIAWTFPVALIINKIIDLIPGLNKIDFSIEKANKRLGIMGDPVLIGLFVGALLGILTKQNFSNTVTMGIGIAGVMLLMPKMVGIMMEGLAPVGKAANSFIKKRIETEKEIIIGMDVALGLGDPTTITTTVVTIPLVILFALILPGVQFFPVGMLTSVCYFAVVCTLASNGNLFRSVISTLIYCIISMYTCAYVAPGATAMLNAAGLSINGLGTDVSVGSPIWGVLIYWLSTIFQ
ncbi:PTS transporter subunit IIC [Propionispira arboris]|nr:PTS transporter subunit IIC [Propionispira arboris]